MLAAARDRGLAAGIFAGSPEHASRMVEKGFRFVNVSTDVRIMAGTTAEIVAQLKGE